MQQNKYAKLVSEVINRKQFLYTKGKVSLDFTLRVDRNEELLAFKECMEEAMEEINKCLEELSIKDVNKEK